MVRLQNKPDLTVYAPKDSFTPEETLSGEISNINTSSYIKEITTFNIDGINYGSGIYEIYSSEKSDDITRNKSKLLTGGTAYRGYYNYDNSLDSYRVNNYIIIDYLGDWPIIKFPVPFILTKHILRPAFLS
jgi:hypothetical protein